ncbi:MAG: glycosyltransferase family 9 protein [Desulfovibrio sp.]|jgi:ADP-heptose:LPS heptosyltransferase|nr:glycosyltransferase family 9 protein [Desulfovibrio sp.]
MEGKTFGETVRHVLVVQLARFGDLLQSKRLLLSLAAEPDTTVHLCLDVSLASLASLVYPQVQIHAIPCHRNAGVAPRDMLPLLLREGARLAGLRCEQVYFLNASPLSYALAALFPPETARGYVRDKGQNLRGPWTRLAARLLRRRQTSPLNLVDFWAWQHPAPIAPEQVNPLPGAAGSGRVGVVMAGRETRRSLPPETLALVIQAVFQARGGPRLVCLGSGAERPLARRLARLLPPRTAECLEDATGRTSLEDLPEILRGLDLLLSPDTGIMHLAAHLGTPVLAFFLASARCFETGPYGWGHRVWQANLPCVPCLESAPCPRKHACLAPFARKDPLALLAGRSAPDWPEDLLGCVTALDALGGTCRVVDGRERRAEERLGLRSALGAYLGISGLEEGCGETAALYEETDWMLPPGKG